MISKRDYTKRQIVNNKKVLYGKRQIQTDRQTGRTRKLYFARQRKRERERERTRTFYFVRGRDTERERVRLKLRGFIVYKCLINAAGTHSL